MDHKEVLDLRLLEVMDLNHKEVLDLKEAVMDHLRAAVLDHHPIVANHPTGIHLAVMDH